MKLETTGVYIALLVTALIGVWAIFKTNKKSQTNSEYFTAFGFLDKKRVFFSVFATTFSAFTVIGLPAMFYAHGIGTLWFMWIGILLTPLTLWFIGKKLISLSIENRNKFSSPVGLLTSGYESKTLTLVLSLVTIIVLFPYLTLQISGIGKFIVSVSNGSITYILGTIFCCLVVGFYIFTGGARADAETDLIQGIILVLGTIIVGLFLYFSVHGEIGQTIETLKEQHLLSIPGPKKYFTLRLLFSYGVIFTLISISTPQVSQKLMGVQKMDDIKPLIKWYAPIGSIVIFLAASIGLYAAANLKIASPDFVTGDVLRSLSTNANGFLHFLFLFIAIFFMAGVISAAVSTIDSLLLAVSGIISDNFSLKNNSKLPSIKLLTVTLLLVGFLFSSKPPIFIVSLAQIQLAGLTAILPCLLGPLLGIKNKNSGWLALFFGLIPVVAGNFFGVNFWGFDIGLIGLISGGIGLLLGKLITRN